MAILELLYIMRGRIFFCYLFWLMSVCVQAQPVLQYFRLISGRPLTGEVREGSPSVITTNGVFQFDGTGNVIAADTSMAVTAGVIDETGRIFLAGMMDTNGISVPYVRMLSSTLQQVFLQTMSVSSNYKPFPSAIAFDGDNRIYLGGPATDSLSVPIRIQYFAGLDTSGIVYWSYVYAVGTDDQAFKDLKCDPNGNAVVGSDVGLSGVSSGEMHFRKFDKNGVFVYENLFDPIYARDILNDFAFGVNGQTYLTGPFNTTGIFGNTVSALVVFDSSGLFSNFTTFDASGYDEGHRLTVDSLGNIFCIVSGTDPSMGNTSHFDIMRYTDGGAPVWNVRHQTGVMTYQKAHDVCPTSYGPILIAGEHRNDTLSPRSGIVVAYDANGSLIYENIDPLPGYDISYKHIISVNDSLFFVIGDAVNANGELQSVIGRYGSTFTDVSHMMPGSAPEVFPNPSRGSIWIRSASVVREIDLFDLTGKRQKTMKGNGESSMKLEGLENGFYLVTVKTDAGIYRHRLVVE